MGMKIRINKTNVEAAVVTAQEYILWDDHLPGFGVRIFSSGRKTYVVQYRTRDGGRSRRLKLGVHGRMTPDIARRDALTALAAVQQGRDPSAEKKANRVAETVRTLCDRFLAEHVAVKNRPSTQREVRRIIEKRIKPKLGMLKVAAVLPADVQALHSALSATPREANQTRAVCSKMMNFAEMVGLRPPFSNPCRGISKYPEKSRDRFYRDDELARIFDAIRGAEEAGELWSCLAAIRLLAFSGCRLGEVISLRWNCVDLPSGVLSLPEAKGGARQHQLGRVSIQELAALPRSSEWVFPRSDGVRPISANMVEKAWDRIRKAANIVDGHLHDFRHTVGTYAGQTGTNAFLIRDKLGHKGVAMTARYVNSDQIPVRVLSDQIEERIAAARDKLVRLPRAG
jgi:integrase